MTYKNSIVQTLQTKLANRQMSLLVGAGFSKNVSRDFPDWNELLKDLVYELYQFEIEREIPKKMGKQDRENFISRIIDHKIEKEGYLNIVSLYIKKKGIAESIVTYIEDKIPIIEEEGKFYLIVNNKKEPLTEKHLSLHHLLMNLPWNNIYTTNYDPLLECCVDTNNYKQLVSENRKLNDHFDTNEKEIFLEKEKENELRIELDKKMTKKEVTSISSPISTSEDLSIGILSKEIDALMGNIMQLSRSIDKRKGESETILKQINNNEKQMKGLFTVVYKGAELSLKKNKNIIKLHGSLRSAEQRKANQFGFDGDPHKQYVISAEHYAIYPEQHQAFTQLMRISLLQESFCLVGFSGIDPNFLEWIKWVRDLLQRQVLENATINNNKKDYKIYLIDLDENEAKLDRLLFYENHSIVRIPLLDKDILAFLSTETQLLWDGKDPYASALKMLFTYLGSHEQIQDSALQQKIDYEKEWGNIWRQLLTYKNEAFIDKTKIPASLKQIKELNDKFLIPRLRQGDLHDQQFFIHWADQILADLAEEKEYKDIVSLLVYATNKYFVPIKRILSEKTIGLLKESIHGKLEVRRMLQLNTILENPLNSINKKSNPNYEDVLAAAFSLNFEHLTQLLQDWKPEVEEMHLKAGILAWSNVEEATTLLEDQIRSGKLNPQQLMYSMELLSYFTRSKSWGAAKKLNEKIRAYEQAGYESIHKNMDYLLEKLTPAIPQIQPYGKGRFTISNTVSFVSHFEGEYTLQTLLVLVRTGFPIRLHNLTFIDAKQWYNVFSAGYKYYVFPYLYYSLQLANEDILKRIGQDLSYTDGLPHDQIVKALLDSFFFITDERQESVMLILSELLICTHPDKWTKQYLKIWNNLLEKRTFLESHETASESFIIAGIRLLEDDYTLYIIIEDLISNLKQDSTKVIKYLFHLNSNYFFRGIQQRTIPTSLQRKVNALIKSIPVDPENCLFALGNIYTILNERQLKLIKRLVLQVNLPSITNERVWRILLYFGDGNSLLAENVKIALLDHSSVWFTGIEGNSVSRGSSRFLSLRSITYSEINPRGVTWDEAEIFSIYEKMKIALLDINRIISLQSIDLDFSFELEEMDFFIKRYEKILSIYSDYELIRDTISLLYHKGRAYETMEEGLLGNDQSIVIWALSELSLKIEMGECNTEILRLFLNKLLMQADPCLEASLNYLATWLHDKDNQNFFSEFKPILVEILKQYRRRPLENVNVPYVEEMLVRIADAIFDLAPNEPAVTFWLKKANNSRYIRVRQWLRYKRNSNLE